MRRLIISARRKRLIYAHMRDVQGTVPKFHECFLGEGNFDPFEVIYALKHSGFDGFIVSDHVPAIEGDTTWGHRVRYADTGYMRGLMEAIDKMEARAGRKATCTLKYEKKELLNLSCPLSDTHLAQIGFIVRDIEKTRGEFAVSLTCRNRQLSTVASFPLPRRNIAANLLRRLSAG